MEQRTLYQEVKENLDHITNHYKGDEEAKEKMTEMGMFYFLQGLSVAKQAIEHLEELTLAEFPLEHLEETIKVLATSDEIEDNAEIVETVLHALDGVLDDE